MNKLSSENIKKVYREVKRLKRNGWKLKNDTVVMEVETITKEGEDNIISRITWQQIKRLVKRV